MRETSAPTDDLKKAFQEIYSEDLDGLSRILENYVRKSSLPLEETLKALITETDMFYYYTLL